MIPADFVRPFPANFIHQNPNGYGVYVEHSTVVQRILQVAGPYHFEVVKILHGDVIDTKTNDVVLPNVVVGAVCRLTLEINGKSYCYEEVGDVEHPGNWRHDGARMKDAMSDAIKRCAMRAGIGLHLWAQDEFYLYDRLRAMESSESPMDSEETEPSGSVGTGEGAGGGTAAPDPGKAAA